MVIVLGSGGHTREILGLLRQVNPSRYSHRTYIASSGDDFALERAREIDSNIQANKAPPATKPTDQGELSVVTGVWDLKIVPRARLIHQSILTTPFSAAWSMFACIMALRDAAKTSRAAPFEYPDIVMTNGPATAVMVILASLVLKFFGFAPVWKMRIVYVESWARVNSLSLSGKIILWFGLSDAFVVQWEKLAQKINGNGRKRVRFFGFLSE
jgi:beta-1,4-N-acetylglucosaminyltransferase